jgi:alkaline phosphatase D
VTFTASQSLGQVLTHGPVVGGVTAYDARVFVRTNQQADVSVHYGTEPELMDFMASNTVTTYPKADFTRMIHVKGLVPKTTYYMNIIVNNVPQIMPPYPQFTTFPKPQSPIPFKFIILTDFDNQRLATEAFQTFFHASREKPIFAFIGGDFDHRNPTNLSTKRQMFKDLYNPNSIGLTDFVNEILRKTPIIHQWDDHDSGTNNVDKTYPNWSLSSQVFREYTPTYRLPDAPNGIWHRFSYAHVDFFVLDNRSQRDQNSDPDDLNKSMLDGNNLGSSGQIEWLKNGLLFSKATWKIIFSSVVTNPTTKKDDGWATFQTEWMSIRKFIEDSKINNIVFISGDLHIGGIDMGIASGFPEMVVPSPNLIGCASGEVGRWSHGVYASQSEGCRGYGVVTVLTDPHRLLLEVKDENGNVRVEYTIEE